MKRKETNERNKKKRKKTIWGNWKKKSVLGMNDFVKRRKI